jgi:hypothetical protein
MYLFLPFLVVLLETSVAAALTLSLDFPEVDGGVFCQYNIDIIKFA